MAELEPFDGDGDGDEVSDGPDERQCPICLNSPSSKRMFVQGHCRHAVCQSCMERLLLAPNHHRREDDALSATAPARGPCPICRSELNFFELVNVKDEQEIYEKDFDVSNWPVAGLVYIIRGKDVGEASLHFPKEAGQRPYFYRRDMADYFDEGCHFHRKTLTFHATRKLALRTGDPGHIWELNVRFSSDLRYISYGVYALHIIPPTPGQSISNLRKMNPLDGTWTVTWQESGECDRIHILASAFKHGPFRYLIDTKDPTSPRFTWPRRGRLSSEGVEQWALSGVDLTVTPEGPAVGSSIEWVTSEGNRIEWTRETVGDPYSRMPLEAELLGPRHCLYHRLDMTESQSHPVFVEGTLWGNTFCQAFKVGLASYHFMSEQEGSYISYEHPDALQWPLLDDGSPVPSRVRFHNVTLDASQRIFRGTIEWYEDYGTTWQGCRKWIYEMKFDSEYVCIVNGVVKSVITQSDEPQLSSTFGETLVYLNAALEGRFQRLLRPITANDDNEERDGFDARHQRFRQISDELQQRLGREGASVRTVAAICIVLFPQRDA